MRMAPPQFVATHSKRRAGAVVESRVDLVERGRTIRLDEMREVCIGCAFTRGRIARRTTASGRRLDVALPLSDQKSSCSTIPISMRLVPTLDPNEATEEVEAPPIRRGR